MLLLLRILMQLSFLATYTRSFVILRTNLPYHDHQATRRLVTTTSTLTTAKTTKTATPTTQTSSTWTTRSTTIATRCCHYRQYKGRCGDDVLRLVSVADHDQQDDPTDAVSALLRTDINGPMLTSTSTSSLTQQLSTQQQSRRVFLASMTTTTTTTTTMLGLTILAAAAARPVAAAAANEEEEEVIYHDERRPQQQEQQQQGNAMPTSSSVATVPNDVRSATAMATATAVMATTNTLDITTTTTTAAAASRSVVTPVVQLDWTGIIQKAAQRAWGGGKAGAAAAIVQVISLMWLRTSMNWQYRNGGTLQSSLQTLWAEGGIPRLYQGLPFAIIQGPLTRFGDTAANVGILALLDAFPETREWPLPLKTACGSVTAGLWRIFLMPVDTSKTAMQVEGQEGLNRLWGSVVQVGPSPLYRGAWAQAAATAAGHFPWFATYNFLDDAIPTISATNDLFLSLARSAFLGLSASCVSDTVSNSLRVIKTTKQTAQLGKDWDSSSSSNSSSNNNASTTASRELSYPEVVALIVEKDGWVGLFGRGLPTRLLTNAIQGSIFSVFWKYFQQMGGAQ